MDDDEDDFNPGDDDLEAMLALQEQEEALRQAEEDAAGMYGAPVPDEVHFGRMDADLEPELDAGADTDAHRIPRAGHASREPQQPDIDTRHVGGFRKLTGQSSESAIAQIEYAQLLSRHNPGSAGFGAKAAALTGASASVRAAWDPSGEATGGHGGGLSRALPDAEAAAMEAARGIAGRIRASRQRLTTGNGSAADPSSDSCSGGAARGGRSYDASDGDYLYDRPPLSALAAVAGEIDAEAAAESSSAASGRGAWKNRTYPDCLQVVLPRSSHAVRGGGGAGKRAGRSRRYDDDDDDDYDASGSGGGGEDEDGEACYIGVETDEYERLVRMCTDTSVYGASSRRRLASMRAAGGAAAAASRLQASLLEMQGNLLPVPIGVLLQQLEQQRQEERTLDAVAAATAARAAVDADDADDGTTPVAAATPISPAVAHGSRAGDASSSALWVDRYAPRSFTDLLSPESINRNVLKWIKLWDARVFGSGASASAAAAAGAAGGAGAAASGSKRSSSAMTGFFASKAPAPGSGGSGGGAAGADGAKRGRFGDASDAGASRFRGGSAGAGVAGSGGPYFGPGWRPDTKVLLLCGPPGTGKTTLAHIAAKQAGYRAIEINASDDRSGSNIRDKIATAQNTQSVFGERRPALVILDEIDGIEASGAGGTGGIQELVAMIKATPSLMPKQNSRILPGAAGKGAAGGRGGEGSAAGGDDDEEDALMAGGDASASGSGGAGKKKPAAGKPGAKAAAASAASGDAGADGESGSSTGGVQPLTRPLICICNDQYAPALRDLRPLVQIIEFRAPDPERLASRLKHICTTEGLAITKDALQSLVSITDADIRSSLNTLQFIKYQAKRRHHVAAALPGGDDGDGAAKATAGAGLMAAGGSLRVTTDMILRASVGIKDQTKALMDVWSAIFKQPDTRMRSTVALSSLGMTAKGGDHTLMTAAAKAAALQQQSAIVAAAAFAAEVRASAGLADEAAGGASGSAMGAPHAAATQAANHRSQAAAAYRAYLHELSSQISAYAGEPRLFLAGLHENIPEARGNDPTLSNLSRALDWVCWGEELVHKSHGTHGAGALSKFLPLVGIGVHAALASDMKMKLVWPRGDAALRSQRDHRRNIVRTFLTGRASAAISSYAHQAAAAAAAAAARNAKSTLADRDDAAESFPAPAACGSLDVSTAVLDIISPLLTIVSPPLRPVSFGLLNTREKRDAYDLVETLATVGLTFTSRTGRAASRFGSFGRDAEETTYALSPEINLLVEYGHGYDAWAPEVRASLPDVLKQLVAHEVRRARIRKQQQARNDVARAGAISAGGAGGGGAAASSTPAVPRGPTSKAEATAAAAAAFSSKRGSALDSSTSSDLNTSAASDDGAAAAAAVARMVAGSSFLAQAALAARQAEIRRKRAQIAIAEAGKGTTGHNLRNKYPVVLRYQDGYTNAVRRPVKLADFL